MRSFVVSIIILLLCFGIASVNCIWVSSLISDLLDDIEDLTRDEVESFSENWSSAERILLFTSKRSVLRDISYDVQHLVASVKDGDDFEFEAAKNSIIYKMKELRRSHRFDLKSIL